jgi:hypothetical protein
VFRVAVPVHDREIATGLSTFPVRVTVNTIGSVACSAPSGSVGAMNSVADEECDVVPGAVISCVPAEMRTSRVA